MRAALPRQRLLGGKVGWCRRRKGGGRGEASAAGTRGQPLMRAWRRGAVGRREVGCAFVLIVCLQRACLDRMDDRNFEWTIHGSCHQRLGFGGMWGQTWHRRGTNASQAGYQNTRARTLFSSFYHINHAPIPRLTGWLGRPNDPCEHRRYSLLNNKVCELSDSLVRFPLSHFEAVDRRPGQLWAASVCALAWASRLVHRGGRGRR